MSNITGNISISNIGIGISIQSIVLKQHTTAMHIQEEQSSVGGTISEQCLITKALGGATGMTWLRL